MCGLEKASLRVPYQLLLYTKRRILAQGGGCVWGGGHMISPFIAFDVSDAHLTNAGTETYAGVSSVRVRFYMERGYQLLVTTPPCVSTPLGFVSWFSCIDTPPPRVAECCTFSGRDHGTLRVSRGTSISVWTPKNDSAVRCTRRTIGRTFVCVCVIRDTLGNEYDYLCFLQRHLRLMEYANKRYCC